MALTFTPTGNGVTPAQATLATTTMVIFRNVLPETDITIEVCEESVPANFVRVFGSRDAVNAGEAPEALNLAVPVGWFIRVKVNGFDGAPVVVIE